MKILTGHNNNIIIAGTTNEMLEQWETLCMKVVKPTAQSSNLTF